MHDPKNKECHMFRPVHQDCHGANEVCNDCSCSPTIQHEDGCHRAIAKKFLKEYGFKDPIYMQGCSCGIEENKSPFDYAPHCPNCSCDQNKSPLEEKAPTSAPVEGWETGVISIIKKHRGHLGYANSLTDDLFREFRIILAAEREKARTEGRREMIEEVREWAKKNNDDWIYPEGDGITLKAIELADLLAFLSSLIPNDQKHEAE